MKTATANTTIPQATVATMISMNQIADLVHSRKGATPVTLEAVTDARLKKTGNPYGKVYKYQTVNGMVGADYGLSVKRQQIKAGNEPDFEAGKLPYGEWVNDQRKVVEHTLANGSYMLYLRIQFVDKEGKPLPKSKALPYPVYKDENGNVIPYEDVKPFLPAKSKSKKQENAGVENEIAPRLFKFDSIKAIRAMGQNCIVKQNVPLKAYQETKAEAVTA